MRRVVVTGLGVVSAIGNSVEEFWGNIEAGKHGITEITRFDTSEFPVKVAAEVKNFNPEHSLSHQELKRTDRYTQYAIEAAYQAMQDSGTDFSDIDPFRVGVVVGSGIGGIETFQDGYDTMVHKGIRRVSPLFIPMLIANMASGMISMKYGFKGMNFAPVSACASSAHALGEAFRAIKHGYIDVALAGGSEAVETPIALAGFNNMMATTKATNPDRASIPFDAERSGFVLGEGSAVLVLEELEHALARGAKIYAELAGYGATADAYHITSPDPSGEAASMAMQLAFKEAGAEAKDIDYINAHGTSTPINDKYETGAIKDALGEYGKTVAVSSTKSMTGHLLGGAGATEAVICAKAIEQGVLPPNVGLQNPDPECDLNIVKSAEKAEINVALSNSYGFGGQNASLCFKAYK